MDEDNTKSALKDLVEAVDKIRFGSVSKAKWFELTRSLVRAKIHLGMYNDENTLKEN